MSLTARIGVVIIWIASVFAVASLAAGQLRNEVPVASPSVISGADIGFRIEANRGQTPVGRLVIRVNGQWVEPDWTMKVEKATTPR